MKSILFLSLLLVSTLGFAQKKREPSAACKFDIKSMVIRSETPKDEADEKAQKVVYVFPELKDFSEMIPNYVSLKFDYESSGCKEPLVAQVSLVPGADASKKKPKTWYQNKVKLEKLQAAGEVVVREIPVLEHFTLLSPETMVNSVVFDVIVLEGGREVSSKSLVVDSPTVED